MAWQESSRKLRIEGGGCADMTRMLSYFTDQDPPITDVLSQVRTSSQNECKHRHEASMLPTPCRCPRDDWTCTPQQQDILDRVA